MSIEEGATSQEVQIFRNRRQTVALMEVIYWGVGMSVISKAYPCTSFVSFGSVIELLTSFFNLSITPGTCF